MKPSARQAALEKAFQEQEAALESIVQRAALIDELQNECTHLGDDGESLIRQAVSVKGVCRYCPVCKKRNL